MKVRGPAESGVGVVVLISAMRTSEPWSRGRNLRPARVGTSRGETRINDAHALVHGNAPRRPHCRPHLGWVRSIIKPIPRVGGTGKNTHGGSHKGRNDRKIRISQDIRIKC